MATKKTVLTAEILASMNEELKERLNAKEEQIKILNEMLGAARKEAKQIEILNNKLISYKKVIQFMAGIENGDVLLSEVR